MAVSKSQQKAVTKYVKENYDRISITVPKGGRELMQAAASMTGDGSVNALVNRLVAAELERLQISGHVDQDVE